MRKIKKFLCALMAVLLVLSAVPAYGAEQADDGTEEKPLVQKVERMLTGMRITGAIPASILDYEEFRFGYGQNGELISKLSVTKDGNVDYGTHKEYGPSGQLVSQTYYGPTTTKAEYDESGRILRELELVDGEFVQYRVYQYDDRGLLLEASELIDGEYLPFGIYEYNDRGLLTHEWLRYYADDLEFSYTYEYDDLGRLRKKIDDRFVGMVGPLFCIVEQYEYDDCGRLIYEQPPKTSGAFRYEYDDNGHMTRKTVLVSYDAETQEITGDYRYEYDDAGRLLRTLDLLQSTTDGDSADYHVVEEYTYDAQGLLTTSYEEYDGFQDHMEYQYDNSGKKIKEILTETYLPDTVRKAHGEREYFYNPAGRLVRTLFIEQVTARDGTVHSRTDEVLHFGQFRFSTWVETSSSGETEKTFWITSNDFTGLGSDPEKLSLYFSYDLTEANCLLDDQGYLTKVEGTNDYGSITFEFTYSDVEVLVEDADIPQPPVKVEGLPYADVKYPLNENDGYVLYKNFCGADMDAQSRQVKVARSGSGEEECLTYTVYAAEDTACEAPIETFVMYVNSGICETVGADGTQYRFRAEDYYVLPLGQLNGDSTVDYMDAMLTLRAAVKLTTLNGYYSAAADVNRDGTVDYMDAMMILRYAVKLTDSF